MAENKRSKVVEENIDEEKEDVVKATNFSAEENIEKSENKKDDALEKQEPEIKEALETDSNNNENLGLSSEYAEDKIKQALEMQSPKKKRKSTIISLLLLLVNLIFMFYIVKGLIANVGENDISSVIETQGSKVWWLAGGVGMYVVYIIAQVLMYYVLIKDITGKKRLGLSYDVAIVGKYYDNVTPFAVGGQPMQIVRLAKSGISAGISTSIPIIKMMFNSAVNMLVALLFFIFGVPKIPLTSPLNDMLLILLIIVGVIGLIITVIVVSFMFLVASGTLITRSFISNILRIGYKLKIVKNYRQSFQKILNQVAEYKVSFNYMWKNKKTLFKILGLSLVECLSYAVMPYFVVMAFGGPIDMNPWLFLVICISQYYICFMASTFIPLPGGTGLMEISFIFLFGIIVGSNVVWALLAWRILSYYMIVVHGFAHELIHITKGIIKNRKGRELN